jgi:hypothetical protein
MASNPGRGETAQDPGREIVEGGDEAARLPSLEEQTPGLDQQQDQRTLRDAETFYGAAAGADAGPVDDDNQAIMSEQDMQEPPRTPSEDPRS